VITLTTDFGLADGYQGVLEGIIAGINPNARIVTISHEIEPGDIPGAWYLLKTHYRYFPPGTIHVAVIDPGVGSRRRIIAVSTERYQFVAPDNGLLSFIPDDDIVSIHAVTDRK
jgi:S-adenosylmethionine hydrolase